jgi:hypothetical protein
MIGFKCPRCGVVIMRVPTPDSAKVEAWMESSDRRAVAFHRQRCVGQMRPWTFEDAIKTKRAEGK